MDAPSLPAALRPLGVQHLGIIALVLRDSHAERAAIDLRDALSFGAWDHAMFGARLRLLRSAIGSSCSSRLVQRSGGDRAFGSSRGRAVCLDRLCLAFLLRS